jgi:alpha-1,3-rhamnosyl/mannosyltransferase
MPVLEAMAAGLPVVTSNRSALPEVAADAALLVDPEKINDIVRALERVLESSRLREKLRQAGLARAAQFSWIKAAHETLRVYRKVA